MSLSILANYSAVRNTGVSVPFGATGGTAPYVFSVAPGGAGGTINSATGMYASPRGPTGVDTILVTDAAAATASVQIKVGTPILLVCNIIEKCLGIPGQVWLYNQKIELPNDSKDYIAVGIRSRKAFGGRPAYIGGDGFTAVQSVNVMATLSIDLLSRSTLPLEDVDRVVMALSSPYAEKQMELNSFFVAPLPASTVNISGIDGPAIPYHLQMSANIQYASSLTSDEPFFATFDPPSVLPNP